MQRIFITGGTGFVGSALQRILDDRPVRLLVRERDSDRRDKSPLVETVRGDITDPLTLRGAMDGCDAVIHLVAIIAEEDGATFDDVIRRGMENVLTEGKRAGVSRFLYMSALGARDDPRYGYPFAKY
jgi:NADH dehydrogenase